MVCASKWNFSSKALVDINLNQKHLNRKNKKFKTWNFLLTQQVKDPALSLLWLTLLPWCGFDPWPESFHMQQA